MERHAYCDASADRDREQSVGVIICDGRETIVRYNHGWSQRAELETIIKATEMAEIVHHDQLYLPASMRKAKRGLAARLRWIVKVTGVELIADGPSHREYHACHERAYRVLFGREPP